MIDWQFIVVIVATVVAGGYTARVFLRQFRRADDDKAGCAGCPVAERPLERNHRPGG